MPRVLLHACCGICAGHCISTLKARGDQVTLFFSNANIAPADEFSRRLDALKTLAKHFDVPVIIDPPNHSDWLENVARGFEDEPERGRRCSRCFRYSLSRTSNVRQGQGFDLFSTTLTVSPHKPSKAILDIGASLDAEHFLPIDFKKNNGFVETNAIARSLGLYRQSYCGCEFSRRAMIRGRLRLQERKSPNCTPEGSEPLGSASKGAQFEDCSFKQSPTDCEPGDCVPEGNKFSQRAACRGKDNVSSNV